MVKDDINNSSFVQFQVSYLKSVNLLYSYIYIMFIRSGTFLDRLTSLILHLILSTYLVDVVLSYLSLMLRYIVMCIY